MATGGDASLYKSGDGVYDFPCSACSEDNLNAEAEFCCNACGKHYCNKCIDPHAKLFKRHDVLTRYFMDQWCKPTPNPVYDELEMCDTHHGKLLELICLDHDKPCCTICVSISHRSCKNIQQITATNPKSNDINIQQLVLSVQDAIENVKEKKSKEYVNKEKLDSYANEARCEIQKCVDELVASLNNLKVSSLDVLEKAVSEWVDRSIERSQSCFSHVTRLLNLKRLLESRVRNGETTTHTGYLACRSKVAKTKALLEELAYEPDPSVSFEPYRQIRHAVSGIQFLGQMTGTIMSKKEATSFTERVFKLEEKIAGNGKSIYVEKTKTTDYKQTKKYSMRITNDNACPAINGILQFENGHFVVIDTTNDRIKLLTNKFNVIDFLDMPKGITGFCNIEAMEAVVTVDTYDQKHILFFFEASNGRLVQKRRIEVDHNCYAVAYHSGTLYVSSGYSICVYDKDSMKIVTKINKHSTIVAVSPDGKHLYSTFKKWDRIIYMDTSGNQIHVLEGFEHEFISHLHISKTGYVFVCGRKDGQVVQVSADCTKKLSTVINDKACIYGATAALLCERTYSLIIALESSEHLYVFKLQ